jgi:hypothetical protein
LASGTSSKGTNTPSGRPKHTDPNRKSNHLKRPGSPNLSASEASGNESARKKHKKKHHSQTTGSSTPLPGSRPMSPVPSSQPNAGTSPNKSNIVKLNVGSRFGATSPGAGSGSDGEATAGEMSDGAGGVIKKKSFKLRIGGNRNGTASPSGSRAGSPAPGAAGISRPGSPAVVSTSKSKNHLSPNLYSLLFCSKHEHVCEEALSGGLTWYIRCIKPKPNDSSFVCRYAVSRPSHLNLFFKLLTII